MKKILAVSLLTIMLILSFSLALEALGGGGPIPRESIGGNFGGSSGTELWKRDDIDCNDFNYPAKQKTRCTAGGQEQCTAKYCN